MRHTMMVRTRMVVVAAAIVSHMSVGPQLAVSGRAFVTGNNQVGQLGDGTVAQRSVPVEIRAGFDVAAADDEVVMTDQIRQVAASSGEDVYGESGYTLFLGKDGTVYASGTSDFFELIDLQVAPSARKPVAISSLGSNIAQVAAGRTHSLFLTSTGEVYAVGFNRFGQLGTGGATSSSSYNRQPQLISFDDAPYGPHTITQIATNQAGFHSLFLTSTGRVFATGLNEHGQLGTNDLSDRNTPTLMLGPSGQPFSNDTSIVMVAAGATFTLLLDSSGAVFAVGGNEYGQLGLGPGAASHTLPAQVTAVADHKIVHLAAGVGHSIFLSEDGRVFVVVSARSSLLVAATHLVVALMRRATTAGGSW